MLSKSAQTILQRRYLQRDEDGEVIETIDELFRRVANAVAAPEGTKAAKYSNLFYDLMVNLDFLPNSPTLMNAGVPGGQLSACFVLPIEDSMEGIFNTLRDSALIHKTGGGTGFSFSRLRAKNSVVKSTGGVASGPISFMKAYNAATETVKQGGKRRGANMGMLRIDHPDIEDFIHCKKDKTELTNFNISVAVTDVFMEAVKEEGSYDLIDPRSGKVVDTIPAKPIWDKIVEAAWESGEPGILFIDRVNKFNNTPALGLFEATNPCVTGDTIIRTVEGEYPIKDLVGKTVDIYCMDKDTNELTISQATDIRLTRKHAELVEIVTTRGSLVCTPDHKIYTRNRGYVEACNLTTKDKLVGLNMKLDDVHVSVALTTKKYRREHRFIAGHYWDIQGKDVHHKDTNHRHNVLSNLEVLSHSAHSKKSNTGHPQWCERDDLGRFSGPTSTERYGKAYAENLSRPVGTNLLIKEVRKVDYKEDVYDLTVAEHHNFLANGIIVHNCGEQPLLPYESCNLGSINLLNMCTAKGINYTKLDRTIELAVRFLDNVIDVNTYPLPEIDKATKLTRKIGLGVMGWADMLLRLNIPYNSVRALELAEKLMKHITDMARDCSRLLGKERGSFPAKDLSIWKDERFMRNAALTTIAPTGTISMLADVSSGIEPIFGYAFTKTVMDNDSFVYVNEILKERLLANGLYTQSTVDSLLKSGRVTALDKVPEDIKEVFVCAYDIAADNHILMQASFQKYTDNAISKTINFPNTATIDDVNDGYILAYNLGCKGVTVYRDGSRDSQVLSLGTGDKKVTPRGRATTTQGFTDKITTGCGNLYITVNYDEHGICEVFTNTGKAGGCPSQSEASARLATLALRANVDHESIIRQLTGIRCPAAVRNKNSQCLSCPDAIARSLKKAIGHKVDTLEPAVQEEDNTTVPCPECGKPILNAEGCVMCPSCGFSKCN